MWIDLPVTYTKEDLPVNDEDVATAEKIKRWKYLERIAGGITQGQFISIGLLIGGNCTNALEPLDWRSYLLIICYLSLQLSNK